MSRYDELNAVLVWTFDGVDEVWRDRNGQMIDPANVVSAMPPDTTWDELSAWAESMRVPVGRD